MVASGALRHSGVPRVYCWGPAPESQRDAWLQQLAAFLAPSSKAMVSRVAAAALWSLDGTAVPTRPEINVGRDSARRGSGIHRPCKDWAPDLVDHLPVTSVPVTLLEMGATGRSDRLSAVEWVELALESALRAGYTTPEELEELISHSDGRVAGRSVLAEVLRQRPPGVKPTGSYLETRFVQVLRQAGLPEPERQVEIHDHLGRVGFFDFRIAKVVIETNGKEDHDPWEATQRDYERADRLEALGYHVLSFSYDQVEYRPEFVVESVRLTLQW